mmetsp:Transcript_68116/g.197428  ORF Transcript_68116/g.197428 Transcript_68116/m.197428 type:complete len:278 (+) Transcript_68116:821-1654(+)
MSLPGQRAARPLELLAALVVGAVLSGEPNAGGCHRLVLQASRLRDLSDGVPSDVSEPIRPGGGAGAALGLIASGGAALHRPRCTEELRRGPGAPTWRALRLRAMRPRGCSVASWTATRHRTAFERQFGLEGSRVDPVPERQVHAVRQQREVPHAGLADGPRAASRPPSRRAAFGAGRAHLIVVRAARGHGRDGCARRPVGCHGGPRQLHRRGWGRAQARLRQHFPAASHAGARGAGVAGSKRPAGTERGHCRGHLSPGCGFCHHQVRLGRLLDGRHP